MLFICSLASDQSFMSKPSNRYNRVRYKQIYNKIINAFALIFYLCNVSAAFSLNLSALFLFLKDMEPYRSCSDSTL